MIFGHFLSNGCNHIHHGVNSNDIGIINKIKIIESIIRNNQTPIVTLEPFKPSDEIVDRLLYGAFDAGGSTR